jgi:Tfp pilus assembly protein PilO
MTASRTYLGAVLVALAGALFFLLVLPQYDAISARRAALAERSDLLTERQGLVKKIDDWKKEMATRADDIKDFSYIVPATKDAPDLVSMIQALASENGLQLNGLSMGTNDQSEGASYATQSLDLSLAGGYVAFRSFMDEMEKNIRIIDIDSIDAAPTTENSPVIGFRVKAHAYFLQ